MSSVFWNTHKFEKSGLVCHTFLLNCFYAVIDGVIFHGGLVLLHRSQGEQAELQCKAWGRGGAAAFDETGGGFQAASASVKTVQLSWSY